MREEIWTKFVNKQYHDVLAEAGNVLKEMHALDYIHVAGLSLISLGKFDEGMDWVAASLSLAEASPGWFANGATACMEKERYVHAILFLTNGLKEHPKDLRMTYMQGLCHVHIHEWGKAIAFFNETLEIDPKFYHANLGIGFCYHMLGLYQTALDHYELITEGDPEDMETVHNNYACVLMELGRQQDALDYLIKKCPGSTRPGTLYNMSFLYLGMGIWELGWQLYKYRDTVVATNAGNVLGSGAAPVPKVDHPIAQSLQDIHGKHLLLFHEQGFGDTIQFMRYARMLETVAARITIGVPTAMKRLVQNMVLYEKFDVVDSETVKCDIALPMLDAPLIYDTWPNDVPWFGPYISIPSDVRSARALPIPIEKARGPFRIGLVWAGATRLDNIRAHSIDRRRSVPFELFSSLLDLHKPGVVEFYSLQKQDHHKEHENMIRVIEDDFDLLDTAAIIDQLDLVITIDSAVAHLAGALGKPVWMLSRFDGCWRWGWKGETTTAWYPTMRIFRQPAHDTWPEVIEWVKTSLCVVLEHLQPLQ